MKTKPPADVPPRGQLGYGEVAPTLAARVLSSALGDSEITWLTRLANARRPGRRSVLPWGVTEAGNPTYALDDINAFIAQKQRSVVRPEAVGALASVKATAVPDIDGDVPRVTVLFNAGLGRGAFDVSLQMARSLSRKLTEAADKAAAVAAARDLGLPHD